VKQRRILIFGNSGSGKTTLARSLCRELDLPRLDLDSVAWAGAGVRRAFEESVHEIEAFMAASGGGWVVEGCYGDLLEVAAEHATELHFLNPGVDVCVAHCRARPWEPDKYPNREEQNRMLDFLISWVREYETRTDEYSLARHRAIFERFAGAKREVVAPATGIGGGAARAGRTVLTLLAIALLGGCATFPEAADEWARHPGWILPNEGLGPVLELPDTVRRGVPVTATVVTRGSSSCTRADGAEVVVAAHELRITPYDRVAPRGTPCTRDLAAFPRAVELRFTGTGEVRVIVIGRDAPDGEPVEVTRRVTVLP
jgi:adenylate kinase family enzyme